jgi:hypothetical protein
VWPLIGEFDKASLDGSAASGTSIHLEIPSGIGLDELPRHGKHTTRPNDALAPDPDVAVGERQARALPLDVNARGKAARVQWVRDGFVVPGWQRAQTWGLARQALALAADRGEKSLAAQIRTSRPFLSSKLSNFRDGPLGRLSPISH